MSNRRVASSRPTALSLFSGIGGLDLGWEIATGGRVVGYAERDAYAAATLLVRMEGQAMEPAPVWCGDITDLDVAPFHGVDWVIGGFPCQDISSAGTGAGIDGERSGLWSELLRAYRDTGARWLFVENVAAITVRGLDRVLADLAEIGCTAQWLCVRASDVGAPHRRERLFLLADTQRSPIRNEPRWLNGPRGEGASGAGNDCQILADSNRAGCKLERGREVRYGQRQTFRHDTDRCDESVGNANFPPGPSADWSTIPAHLHPATKPNLRRAVDGLSLVVDTSRADRLRCLGNAVVPLQSAAALVELMRRMNDE